MRKMGSSPVQGPSATPIGRDLGLAQEAFKLGDAALSREAHAPLINRSSSECEAGHTGMVSPLHHCIVYGALDGLVSSVVAVAALSTFDAATGLRYCLSVVTSIVFGLALGSGLRNYVKYSTEFDTFARERKRELWEMQNYVEGERNEMVELFVNDGVSEADARKAIDLLSQPQYEQFFVDLMMVKELNMQIPDKRYPPVLLGLATAAIAFGTGTLPIVGYLICGVLGLVRSAEPVDIPALLVVVAGLLLAVLAIFSTYKIQILPHRSLTSVYGATLAICGCVAVGTTVAVGILRRHEH